MEDTTLFYQGGSRHRWDELERILIDILDVSLYTKLTSKFEKPRRDDLIFKTNKEFWKHLLSNKAYVDQYITLDNFVLTEWLPMSPGLFHTEEAIIKRKEAERYVARRDNFYEKEEFRFLKYLKVFDRIPIKNRVAIELDPNGKMSMVLGGIGSLRLQPKKMLNEDRAFLLGATSTGICHEGLPVILTSDSYHKIITQLKEDCGLRCKLIGRLCVLPTDDIPIRYERTIPKYCLFVEEIKNIEKCTPEEILISIAITYSDSLRNIENKKWSFVSFNPDKTDRQLIYSVEWLHDYAKRYSYKNNPIILADFDEYRQHFEKIEFSIKDLANGKIDFIKLAQYEDFLNLKIINVMGDYFSNISNATIINKSVVQNAFNKMRDKFDEDTAAALAQIAQIVEKSGNKEAGETFDDFNEEIQKPEPKKSRLNSFWTTLTGMLPAITGVAGLAEKVIKMIG